MTCNFTINPLIHTNEVTALMTYATRNEKQSEAVTNAIQALGQCLEQHNTPEKESEQAGNIGQEVAMMVAYGQLCSLTYPITGKTLLDSANASNSLRGPMAIFWSCVAVVIVHTGVSAFYTNNPFPPDVALTSAVIIKRYILDVMTPFLWGAIGAFTFLLKKASDLTADRQFDNDMFHGWTIRVGLGAILGGAMQFVYDDKVFSTQGLNLDANAIGYLTGIGTKVVYGAMEKTIEALAEKLNLGAIRQKQDQRTAIQGFLSSQMSAANAAVKKIEESLSPTNPDPVLVKQRDEIKNQQTVIGNLMKAV